MKNLKKGNSFLLNKFVMLVSKLLRKILIRNIKIIDIEEFVLKYKRLITSNITKVVIIAFNIALSLLLNFFKIILK